MTHVWRQALANFKYQKEIPAFLKVSSGGIEVSKLHWESHTLYTEEQR